MRYLWTLAKDKGLRNKRNIGNIKQIVDSLKRLPFDKQQYVQQRWDKCKEKNRGLTLTFPKCLEYFACVGNKIIFDNSKSEDFDVFPYRFWNLSERCRKPNFKLLNLGGEFF